MSELQFYWFWICKRSYCFSLFTNRWIGLWIAGSVTIFKITVLIRFVSSTFINSFGFIVHGTVEHVRLLKIGFINNCGKKIVFFCFCFSYREMPRITKSNTHTNKTEIQWIWYLFSFLLLNGKNHVFIQPFNWINQNILMNSSNQLVLKQQQRKNVVDLMLLHHQTWNNKKKIFYCIKFQSSPTYNFFVMQCEKK